MMVVDDCWLFGVESNPLFDPNNPETAMDLALMDGYPVWFAWCVGAGDTTRAAGRARAQTKTMV